MKNTKGFPLYVKIGLWMINTRKTAMTYFWLSILLAVISALLGIQDRAYCAGLLFLLPALWYWLAIRWVDKNAKWEK